MKIGMKRSVAMTSTVSTSRRYMTPATASRATRPTASNSLRVPAGPNRRNLSCMPSILRSRLALFGLMGIFMIPIGQANLGGLTHVLTCKQQIEQPFTVVIPPDGGEPELLSSLRISREETETSLCGGLKVDPGVSTAGKGTIVMSLPITNESAYIWRGTVTLKLGETSIPVGI